MKVRIINFAFPLLVVGAVIGIISAIAEPGLQWATDSRVADTWRSVVMAGAGMVLSHLFLIIYRLSKLNFAAEDRLLTPMMFSLIGMFIWGLTLCLDLASRLGRDLLTFRTPMATIGLFFVLPSIMRISRILRKQVKRASQCNATTKMTLVDTSQPGPDLSLDRPGD
jgi:hypothetical protein